MDTFFATCAELLWPLRWAALVAAILVASAFDCGAPRPIPIPGLIELATALARGSEVHGNGNVYFPRARTTVGLPPRPRRAYPPQITITWRLVEDEYINGVIKDGRQITDVEYTTEASCEADKASQPSAPNGETSKGYEVTYKRMCLVRVFHEIPAE